MKSTNLLRYLLLATGLVVATGAAAGTLVACGGDDDQTLKNSSNEDDEETTDAGGGGEDIACWDVGSTSNPSCSEPSSCPSPDASRDPTISCYEPHWASVEENITLHIYGEHLVPEDGEPRRVIYRNAEATGTGGRTNEDIEVVSDCHLKVTLYVEQAPSLACGSTIEFRLQRREPTSEEVDAGDQMGVVSDWREIRLTR